MIRTNDRLFQNIQSEMAKHLSVNPYIQRIYLEFENSHEIYQYIKKYHDKFQNKLNDVLRYNLYDDYIEILTVCPHCGKELQKKRKTYFGCSDNCLYYKDEKGNCIITKVIEERKFRLEFENCQIVYGPTGEFKHITIGEFKKAPSPPNEKDIQQNTNVIEFSKN